MAVSGDESVRLKQSCAVGCVARCGDGLAPSLGTHGVGLLQHGGRHRMGCFPSRFGKVQLREAPALPEAEREDHAVGADIAAPRDPLAGLRMGTQASDLQNLVCSSQLQSFAFIQPALAFTSLPAGS